MSIGYVYMLSNASMPGIYKIGMTTRPVNERKKELHSTGVPTPFQTVRTWKVKEPQRIEKLIHKRLGKYRVHSRREFFKADRDEIVSVIDGVLFPGTPKPVPVTPVTPKPVTVTPAPVTPAPAPAPVETISEAEAWGGLVWSLITNPVLWVFGALIAQWAGLLL